MTWGTPCAKFRLPRPFGFRVRADVRDIRLTDGQTDGQTDGRTDGRTTDADHRIMPPRRGHNKSIAEGVVPQVWKRANITCTIQ